MALATLGLGAFVIGTAELVVVGILNIIAEDMAVSISTAGQLVTAYALGISVGGPVVTALTTRFGRRFLLRLSLAVYVAGNGLTAVAVNVGMLIVARAVTGSIHGMFIGVASVVAAGLVPPERRGRAISMVFCGIAVSTVLGVPLGTLLGQALGWRAAFVGVIVLGAVALVATLVFVPPVEGRGGGGLTTQARAAFAPRVLAMLGVGLVVMGGQFTAFTYLAPFLTRITGVSGVVVSVFLLVYGVASAAGTVLGGRAADRSATATLLLANMLLILALGGLYLAGSTPILVAVALAAWGLVGFGLVPALQLRVISLAGSGGDLAATLGASAVNAGIAAGALVGGWATARYGVSSTVLAALVIVTVALPAAWASRLLTAPSAGDGEAAAAAPGVTETVSTAAGDTH